MIDTLPRNRDFLEKQTCCLVVFERGGIGSLTALLQLIDSLAATYLAGARGLGGPFQFVLYIVFTDPCSQPDN